MYSLTSQDAAKLNEVTIGPNFLRGPIDGQPLGPTGRLLRNSMPTVETTTWIDAPLETVYAVSKKNQDFPNFMKDVQSLTIVESDGNRVVSDWVGVVSAFGLKIRWRQEDVWDDEAHVCRFKMLKGDYDKLEGHWTFQEDNGGTRFDSHVDYEYKVPGIGPLIYKVIHGLVVKNLDDTLQAIKSKSESSAPSSGTMKPS